MIVIDIVEEKANSIKGLYINVNQFLRALFISQNQAESRPLKSQAQSTHEALIIMS